jgi:hypothetical protein
MISAVRAAPKNGFLGVRLSCGDIHALKRCFILTITSLSLYSVRIEKGEPVTAPGIPAGFPKPETLPTEDCIRPSA